MDYALSISAVKRNILCSHMATFTRRARSKEEAIGIGIEMALKEYPILGGWIDHACVVCPVERLKEASTS